MFFADSVRAVAVVAAVSNSVATKTHYFACTLTADFAVAAVCSSYLCCVASTEAVICGEQD